MYVGVDLGGTNIAVGIVDENAQLLNSKSRPTNSSRNYKEIIFDIRDLILEVIDESNIAKEEIKSIGIGIPGLADKKGNVIFSVNLGWNDVPLKTILEQELTIPVFIDNDATVAALAEYEGGAMKNVESGVLVTLGTGVGGGIVIKGDVYSGYNGVGSEIGHMVVGENFYDCNCGKNGCLETFASSTAIIKYTKKLIGESKEQTVIMKKVDGDIEKLNAKVIFDSAKEGDNIAKLAVERFIKYLSIGIVNIINFLDPEVIALGGGVSRAGQYLIDLVNQEVQKNKLYKDLPVGKITLAQLGNEAGIIGAAMAGKHGIK